MTPDNPNTSSTLYCNVTTESTDADGDDVNYTYNWYLDNVFNKTSFNRDYNYDVMGSGNTSGAQEWNCTVYAWDGEENSTPDSDKVTINNTSPSQVTLLWPNQGNDTTYNRTPLFKWEAATDDDGDDLTYHIQVDIDKNFPSPEEEQTSITKLNFTPSNELPVNTVLYWRVHANDSFNNGTWSDTWNFTVLSSVIISLINNETQFGFVSINLAYNTSEGPYDPFKIRNDGNIEINLSINATSLWSSQVLDTLYYKYKADNCPGNSSIDTATSQMTYNNMANEKRLFAAYFNHIDDNDCSEADIYILVPSEEPIATRQSTITIYAEES